MKMAKASEADIAMAIELAQALESLTSTWDPSMPEKIARTQGDPDGNEWFDSDNAEQCQRVCVYLIRLARSASLFRVVMGMAVLLDPANKIVDPDADTLEYHPDTVAALEKVKAMTGRDPLSQALNEGDGVYRP